MDFNEYILKEKDNMGACMAPAAADTIYNHLSDFGRAPEYYDKINDKSVIYLEMATLMDSVNSFGDIAKQLYTASKNVLNESGSTLKITIADMIM